MVRWERLIVGAKNGCPGKTESDKHQHHLSNNGQQQHLPPGKLGSRKPRKQRLIDIYGAPGEGIFSSMPASPGEDHQKDATAHGWGFAKDFRFHRSFVESSRTLAQDFKKLPPLAHATTKELSFK